jgi:hypothetical protein
VCGDQARRRFPHAAVGLRRSSYQKQERVALGDVVLFLEQAKSSVDVVLCFCSPARVAQADIQVGRIVLGVQHVSS